MRKTPAYETTLRMNALLSEIDRLHAARYPVAYIKDIMRPAISSSILLHLVDACASRGLLEVESVIAQGFKRRRAIRLTKAGYEYLVTQTKGEEAPCP